jgi:hypothetical protein
MSKVIEVQAWADKRTEAHAIKLLVDSLEYLKAEAEKARAKIDRARTLRIVLEHYARWLGKYHAQASSLEVYVRSISEAIKSSSDVDLLDWATGSIVVIRKTVGGVHPWLSVPNYKSTRYNASTSLEFVIDAAEVAINQLQKLSAWTATGEAA